MKETLIRIAMTLLFLPVLYFILIYDAKNSLAFAIFVAFAGVLAFIELKLMAKKKGYQVSLFLGLPLLILIYAFFYDFEIFSFLSRSELYQSMVFLLVLALVLFFTLQLFQSNFQKALFQLSLSLFALIYLGFMWGSIIAIKQLPHGLKHLIILISATWFCDIGAYFVGRGLGKHKLNLPVSPKKTLEGFIGGVVISAGAAFLACYFTGLSFSWWLLILPFGTIIGDLLESVIKRAFEVKDSSKIIPGHGGILDVFDSLIFNAPLYYFFYRILG